MPNFSKHLEVPSLAQRLKSVVINSLNFYRVHLIVFGIVRAPISAWFSLIGVRYL
jgi:hypothetical protein